MSIFRVADADAVAKKHELSEVIWDGKAAKRTSGVGLSTLGAFGFGFNGFIFLGWHAILGVSHFYCVNAVLQVGPVPILRRERPGLLWERT